MPVFSIFKLFLSDYHISCKLFCFTQDPVILIGDKLPPKPKVDHDEIEKLLGEVPQRQQFVQQLYGQVEFDAEATSRYNRRFSENDFHSKLPSIFMYIKGRYTFGNHSSNLWQYKLTWLDVQYSFQKYQSFWFDYFKVMKDLK